jgi:hypothetical protein
MLLDQEVKYCYSWNRPIESYVQKYFRMKLVCFMILSFQLFIGLDVKWFICFSSFLRIANNKYFNMILPNKKGCIYKSLIDQQDQKKYLKEGLKQ